MTPIKAAKQETSSKDNDLPTPGVDILVSQT